jgi:transposase
MGQAIPFALRKEIIALRQAGQTYTTISQTLHIAYGTIKHFCNRYRKLGDSVLATQYQNCGSKPISLDKKMYRRVLWLKYLHSGWGAGRIYVGLLKKFPAELIPSERTMQRWFREKKSKQTSPSAQ